jgi:hypothetical protein
MGVLSFDLFCVRERQAVVATWAATSIEALTSEEA